jgi:hypothetical protein
MKIVLLVEGDTEKALKEHLKRFLDERAEAAGKPKIALRTGQITLNRGDLRGRIRLELRDPQVSAVVGLVDVYPTFASAEQAKQFLREAAAHDPRFYAHAALHDVEAWLLPFWANICARLGVKRAAPGARPETVDLNHPPSRRLQELYSLAKPPQKYIKPIEMNALLRGKDLTVVAGQCPEFKALLNTLLTLSGLELL